MFNKLCSFTVLSFMAVSSFLAAEIDYEIKDIGTLQTKASESIAINNQGQILGWFNIDGAKDGKQFFVRDRDGAFHELPTRENNMGQEINWRFLTNDGKAYGTYDGNATYAVLYVWDQNSEVIKLGNLPGKDVMKINDLGQVLIKSIVEVENGKSIRRPVIWQNGQVTKLKGAGGDLGIESEESYGLDMNNKGEVVGQSLVSLNYKNEIYKQMHAVKWVNGRAIDLHNKIPKSNTSIARAINDQSDVLMNGYLVREDGQSIAIGPSDGKSTNKNYLFNEMYVVDRNNEKITNGYIASNKIYYDLNSIWMTFHKIVSANDDGEIIANAETIYGEKHIMLLSPIKSN